MDAHLILTVSYLGLNFVIDLFITDYEFFYLDLVELNFFYFLVQILNNF